MTDGKLFNSLALKLKILKGVGTECPKPCQKGEGRISIEEAGPATMIVYRTLTGRTLFSGIFNAKASKSKNEDKPPAKGNGIRYRVKFTVAVKKGSAYAIEWCLASFNSVADRD